MMRVPVKISDLLRTKQEYIDRYRNALSGDIVRLQSRLLEMILTDIIPRLDTIKTSTGIEILNNEHNIRLLSGLDQVYKKFDVMLGEKILSNITKGFGFIDELTANYFEFTLVSNLPEKFINIINKTAELTKLRFGLKNGKFVRGGFLTSILEGSGLEEVKVLMAKAVTAQINTSEFVKQLRSLITGGDDRLGRLEKRFHTFAYDIYQQYDAAYNKSLADEFNMKYFIYQGGIIESSRDFCIAHNNKVWTNKEAEEWPKWTPAKSIKRGDFPEGHEVKGDIYKTPGYMNYDGYDPFIDRGGYNCRHQLGYITKSLAMKLRPGLKKKV